MKTILLHTPMITLGQFLKFIGVIENGAMARDFLHEHHVVVNEQPEDRRGRKLFHGDIVKIDDQTFEIEVTNEQL